MASGPFLKTERRGPATGGQSGAPFAAGERALLVDGRGRRFLVRLQPGASFHFHGGTAAHDEILGGQEGIEVTTHTGARLSCYRPRLADFVLKMPRGAQVIYPKDIGSVLLYADIGSGMSVLEAGTGSGALTLALCRATGPEGRVVSYEVRPDFREKAVTNIAAFFSGMPPWLDLRPGDVRQIADTGETFDRVALDLPDPESVLGAIGPALRGGGILCVYLPTTNQVRSAVMALAEARFREVETFEILLRSWHVAPNSVRPDHRMVAHTGFITVARAPSA